jgi:hypothetical protein
MMMIDQLIYLLAREGAVESLWKTPAPKGPYHHHHRIL